MNLGRRLSYVAFIIGAPVLCLLVAGLAIAQASASVSQSECQASGTPFLICHLSAVGQILCLLSATGIAWPLLLTFAISRLCRDVAVDSSRRQQRIAHAAPIIAGSIVAILLVQGLTLALGIALVEAFTTGHSLAIVALAVVIGTFWTCWRLVDALFLQAAKKLASVVAIPALPNEQPKLWATVTEIAARTGTPVPARLLLGLEPTFYTSVARVELEEDAETHDGPALHLSMPLLRLLDQRELETILLHELAHLSREDPEVAWSFHMLLHRSEAASGAIARMNLLNIIIALPAVTLLHYGIGCFRRLDNFLRHAAELRADRKATVQSAGELLVSALVKVQFSASLWPELEQTVVSQLAKGSALINVSETFGSGAAREMKVLGPKGVFSAAEAVSRNPSAAAHPSFAERCQNLGISFTNVERRLMQPDKPSLVLIADAEKIERKLSQIYQRSLVKSGRAVLPGRAA